MMGENAMIKKISYDNKSAIQNDEDIPTKNKVTDEDMNEIKNVVNNNADELTTAKGTIEDLQEEQGTSNADITSLKTRVSTLETDNTKNKSDINALNSDNKTNKSNIATMQEQISDIQQEQQTQNANIEKLKQEDIDIKEELEKTKKEFNDYAIHGQVSGEFIHLTDSARASCKIDVKGNVKQEIRKGINRCDRVIGNVPKTYKSPATSYVATNAHFDDKFVEEWKENGFTIKVKAKNVLSKGAFTRFILDDTWNKRLEYSKFSKRTKDGYNIYESYVTDTNYNLFSDKRFIVMWEDHSEQTGCDLYAIEIDLGNTVGQDLEKYGASPSLDYPAPIQTVKDSVKVTSCNKNFLDLEKEVIQTKNGITASTNNENELTLNGTSTTVLFISLCENELSINTNANNFKSKKLKKGSYTLSIEKSGETTDNNINLLIRKAEDLSSTGNISAISNIGSKTSALSKFTLEQDQEVKIWLWLNTGNTLSNFKLKIQLEEGDTATAIIGNEQNSITVPVQQEMLEEDCFDKINKKEVHFWDKLKVKDKISRIIKRQTENRTSFNYTVENVKPNTWTVIKNNAICNRFVQVSPYVVEKSNCFSVWNGDNVITITIDNSYLKDVSSDEKILESWNELLNKWESEGEPLELFYERQDSKEIDLTQEQIEALEKLDEMQTYKNITNITTDSIAILDVDYKKDLETWQKQQDDRITALEELLSTTQTSAMLVENLENDLLKEVE